MFQEEGRPILLRTGERIADMRGESAPFTFMRRIANFLAARRALASRHS